MDRMELPKSQQKRKLQLDDKLIGTKQDESESLSKRDRAYSCVSDEKSMKKNVDSDRVAERLHEGEKISNAMQHETGKDLLSLQVKLDRAQQLLKGEEKRVQRRDSEIAKLNAKWLTARARIEFRTLLEHFEQNLFPKMRIKIGDRRFRADAWMNLWNHCEFASHRRKLQQSLDVDFGIAVKNLYNTGNKNAHNLQGDSVVIPKNFSDNEKAILSELCNFISFKYVMEL